MKLLTLGAGLSVVFLVMLGLCRNYYCTFASDKTKTAPYRSPKGVGISGRGCSVGDVQYVSGMLGHES